MTPSAAQRILACLQGVATGDAIGKQTETLSRERVRRWYPEGIRGFEGAPGSVIPRYAGNTKHEWRIGETTDDTENTIAVARAILQDGEVRHASVGRLLLQCTKSVHPGVRSLWEFHQAGDPARVADRHDGCGAAVRVAPVGILYRSDRLDEIVAGAREASISTHGGPLALAAAAATAAAVSAAIDGAPPHEILGLAQRAAALAERPRPDSGAADRAAADLTRAAIAEPTNTGSANTGSTTAGSTTAESSVAVALGAIHADLQQRRALDPDTIAARWFPDSPLTIVPLAIALATVMPSAEAAILLATNTGGDSDSVASIAGAILGARCPETVNLEWAAVADAVNGHDLVPLANGLAALRR